MSLVALINRLKSGLLFLWTGVGTVIIKILQDLRKFLLFVNLIF